jgi:opacity protein-like surface antigen
MLQMSCSHLDKTNACNVVAPQQPQPIRVGTISRSNRERQAENSKPQRLHVVPLWLAFGITNDRILFYVKGGGAWVKESQTLTATGAAPNPAGTLDQTKTGWTAGGGVEYAVSRNWSAKLEYDYLSFGETNNTFILPFAAPAAFNADIRQRVHQVKFGINYKFDWGPVVANY